MFLPSWFWPSICWWLVACACAAVTWSVTATHYKNKGNRMTTYLVTYDRVGKHGGRDNSPAPEPLTVTTASPELLEERILEDARQYLGSRFVEVVVDLHKGRGNLFAGIRTAGSFTVTVVPEGGATHA